MCFQKAIKTGLGKKEHTIPSLSNKAKFPRKTWCRDPSGLIFANKVGKRESGRTATERKESGLLKQSAFQSKQGGKTFHFTGHEKVIQLYLRKKAPPNQNFPCQDGEWADLLTMPTIFDDIFHAEPALHPDDAYKPVTQNLTINHESPQQMSCQKRSFHGNGGNRQLPAKFPAHKLIQSPFQKDNHTRKEKTPEYSWKERLDISGKVEWYKSPSRRHFHYPEISEETER